MPDPTHSSQDLTDADEEVWSDLEVSVVYSERLAGGLLDGLAWRDSPAEDPEPRQDLSDEVQALRGIGYAVLALAASIRLGQRPPDPT